MLARFRLAWGRGCSNIAVDMQCPTYKNLSNALAAGYEQAEPGMIPHSNLIQ